MPGCRRKCVAPPVEFRGSEKLNDLIGVTDTSGSGKIPAELAFRLSEGGCSSFDTTAAGSTARVDVVRQLIEAGYGTNYSSSWFLVRGAARLERSGTADATTSSTHDLKGLGGTLGPLTQRQAETSGIPSSNIPLLGDGAPGDAKEAILTHTIPGTDMVAGARLGESFNDGPAQWNGTKIALMGKGVVITPAPGGSAACAYCDDVLPSPANPVNSANLATFAGADGVLWLQDTRDWFALHGAGRKLSCNILMADGSVKTIFDENGDGYLNPGFPIDPGTADSNDGYLDNTVELAPFEVWSGPDITRSAYKGNFE